VLQVYCEEMLLFLLYDLKDVSLSDNAININFATSKVVFPNKEFYKIFFKFRSIKCFLANSDIKNKWGICLGNKWKASESNKLKRREYIHQERKKKYNINSPL
jgi:hypothetical protein